MQVEMKHRYQISTIAALVAFAIINVIHRFRPVTCWDCFWPYGLPFTFYREGGYGGGGGWVWSGLLADSAVVIFAGFTVTFLWSALVRLRRE
jgi:hypothetical protein